MNFDALLIKLDDLVIPRVFITRVLRLVGRLLWIALNLMVHMLIWSGGWLGLVIACRAKSRREAWFAERLAALLGALGATFVRAGHVLSTRPDLLPPHVIRALARIPGGARAFAWRHVERTIEEDLENAIALLFASFDRRPVASTSMAQVHRAMLRSGEEVSVKICRPGVGDIVRLDVAVMRTLAHALALMPQLRLFAPVDRVRELCRAIEGELDFRTEAADLARFAVSLASDPDVSVPVVYPELCGRGVLTTSFVRGVNVVEAPVVLDIEPGKLARTVLRGVLTMAFDGFVHATLRPANLRVEREGRVCFVDLGRAAEIDAGAERAFARIFSAWANRDGKQLAKLWFDGSLSTMLESYEAYERDMLALVRRHPLGEARVSTVMLDMMNVLRRHHVRPSSTVATICVAIVVTEDICMQVDPRLDLMQEALPFLAGLMN